MCWASFVRCRVPTLRHESGCPSIRVKACQAHGCSMQCVITCGAGCPTFRHKWGAYPERKRRSGICETMPRNLKRYQNTGQLHFITFRCYRRRSFLGNPGKRRLFLWVLESTRQRCGWVVVGYVVMPEHVQLLVSEPERSSLATAMQLLKQNSSRQARKPRNSDQQELFTKSEIRCPLGQKRYYDCNLRTAKKRMEKLKYMHCNPVKRGLCTAPEDWKWSTIEPVRSKYEE